MKTYRFPRSISLTAVAAILVSMVIATQSTVSSVSAQVAADNTQKLISDIQKEIDRRQTVLNNSTGNTTSTSTTNANTANCNSKDVPKSVTDGAQKDASKAGSDLKSLEDSLKSINSSSSAQQKAKQTDDSYESFQVAAIKSAAVGDLCTQAEAKQQLEELISQAKEKLASNQSSSGGSGSSGGSDSGNAEEQIAMLEKLVAAIAAIIASIVALILAIINGDYAAAMTLFQTILGQLAVVATILVEALASVLQINISLGGSS